MQTSDSRFLILRADGETFGISILRVREIVRTRVTTRFPGSPGHIAGVFEWRGTTIPVIRMASRLGLIEREDDIDCRFIVVDYSSAQMEHCSDVMGCGKNSCPAFASPDRFCWATPGTHCRGAIQGTYQSKIDACRVCPYYLKAYDAGQVKQVALLVNAVENVCSLEEQSLEEVTAHVSIDTELITGLGRVDDRLVTILNVDALVHFQPEPVLA